MHNKREDKYNIYTNNEVHVQKQNIFPNQKIVMGEQGEAHYCFPRKCS